MARGYETGKRGGTLNRRQILVGGGAGAGLILGWALWPRSYRPPLIANPDETIFNAFLKIAADGRVTVAVPQAEFGQGSYTALPQILADELGADWRTIAVEAAPVSPFYANRIVAGDFAAEEAHPFFQDISRWAAEEFSTRDALMITGFSSSVRAFVLPLREAGAAARALLCKAAARRWEADWLACDTANGFVVRGEEKLRFGELAEEAMDFKIPDPIPLRSGNENRLVGQNLPRLDLAAKIDGTASFAGDVRLPEMVYAAIRQGPPGDARLVGFDREAGDAVRGVMAVIDTPRWLAAVANNWWAANTALDKMKPRFAEPSRIGKTAELPALLAQALKGPGLRVASVGDVAKAYDGQNIHAAEYRAGLAVHAPMETMSATARFRRGRLEIWMASQAPGLARRAAARALGISDQDVVLHPMMGGGSFGRRLENEVAGQVAILAAQMKRPVQLTWSRAEDLIHDRFRPPALAHMSAKLGEGGRIAGWQARIATPSAMHAQINRMFAHRPGLDFALSPDKGSPDAVAGATPPYQISAYAIDHHPTEIGIRTGYWRSGSHSYTAFFTECFVDELAYAASVDPLSFRMQLLGNAPRLAHCLTTAANLGGWEGGGAGTGQGLACHSMAGSHVAMLVDAHLDENQKIRIRRVVAVADCGRVIHPDLVRQQIEGGIMFGMAAALGTPVEVENGMPVPRNFAQLGLPGLKETPEIIVHLIPSNADPGGASEIAVPPIAPAIANAIAAANGKRMRSIPFGS